MRLAMLGTHSAWRQGGYCIHLGHHCTTELFTITVTFWFCSTSCQHKLSLPRTGNIASSQQDTGLGVFKFTGFKFM